MEVKTFTLSGHKGGFFSFFAFMLASILYSMPAFSQVDYYYGINKKGFRLGVGTGAAILKSNWSSNATSPSGIVSLDYDTNPYFSIGLETQFGLLQGVDAENKFYYSKTQVVYVTGNLNFKVALGQFSDFVSSNGFQDALKRLYIGAGVGMINSKVTLYPHKDGKGLSSDNMPDLAVAAYIEKPKQNSSGNFTESGSFVTVPLNFGTNIALRGFLGIDKVDLNPNLQYNFVQSAVFDGYQPNSVPSKNSFIHVNGNQAYFIGSLTLRFKF